MLWWEKFNTNWLQYIKLFFAYEYVQTSFWIHFICTLSELENMFLVYNTSYTFFSFSYSRFSPLLLSVFFKFKRFKLIHLRWPPAVRIKSCLLSSIFHTSSYQQTTLMADIYKIEALVIKLVRTRTKFVPKLPTKKL